VSVYGQFGSEHYDKIQSGLSCFNKGFYWECHEELEDLWLDDIADNARLVYWVIIQVATSLYHYGNENRAGADGMMKKAQNKLQRMQGKSIETQFLYSIGWQDFVDRVQIYQPQVSDQYFKDWKEFKFQLKDNNV
jgi:uncharacterized protein